MNKPRIAAYAGTFDPITLGHQHIIERAAQLFDMLYIFVAKAHHKTPLFSLEARCQMIEQVVLAQPDIATSISVIAFDGLLIEACRQHGVQTIVRGIRNVSDFEYESQLSHTNSILAPDIQTIFLIANPTFAYINATMVREIARLGGTLEGLVNPIVSQALNKEM